MRSLIVPRGDVEYSDLYQPEGEQAATLKRLAESYTHPNPSDVREVPLVPAPLTSLQPMQPTQPAAPTAPEVDDDRTSPQTAFRLYDMVRPGDTFEVWLDDEELLPLRLAARTDFDGAPLDVKAEYSRLPDGTVYAARSVLAHLLELHTQERARTVDDAAPLDADTRWMPG